MSAVTKLRSAQLVTTFGIGSIVDAPDCSVMIAGQDFWDKEDRTDSIREPRLERILHVSEFRAPKAWRKPTQGQHELVSVPAVRFPLWHFCGHCHRLADLADFGGKSEIVCRRCPPDTEEKRLIPSRFVVACEDGHITDFPWYWWVHRGAACQHAELEISSSGRSTTLGSLTVSCRKCGRSENLEGVFDPGSLAPIRCQGHRPWLDDRVECGKQLFALQRGASNVYFAVTQSAVSIPPFSSLTAKLIAKHWISLSVSDDPEDNRKFIKALGVKQQMPFDDLWSAYLSRKTYGSTGPTPDLRLDEYLVLSAPPPMNDTDDFAAERVPPPPEHAWLDLVVLVHRLRVVTALEKFTRIETAAAYAAPLAKQPADWLPAMEIHGEGIFLRPAAAALDAWKARAGDALVRRVDKLEAQRLNLLAKGQRVTEIPVTAELLLLHTLSHILMRALTLECGYSSSALREILYVRPATATSAAMHGIMVYTAAADSEGSLGGLVRQGAPDRFGRILSDAIETARWCSNDPLCLESESQGMNSLNMAACHSCSLVPETACELFNGFLDRGVLVGTEKNPELAFL